MSCDADRKQLATAVLAMILAVLCVLGATSTFLSGKPSDCFHVRPPPLVCAMYVDAATIHQRRETSVVAEVHDRTTNVGFLRRSCFGGKGSCWNLLD